MFVSFAHRSTSQERFERYQTAIQACIMARCFDYTPGPWYDDGKVAVATNPPNQVAR